ncbi:MAG: DinB family protein [Chloroflexi bacterium]|nr:DinB family protein [Chloroflexota bacterium]
MGAFTYPRSEPGSGGHQDLVERLNSITPRLRDLIDGLPDDALLHRPAEGEWSIKEICGHLRDDGQFLHERLHKMINLEEPFLESWDQEEVLRERNPQEALIQDTLHEFSQQRAETVEMLADLVHWNWARTGNHAERGRLSIRQLVEIALEHEEGHLAQLGEVKELAERAATST